jgi:tripartite-type tricarboxylate transporter receptor subunit TctC
VSDIVKQEKILSQPLVVLNKPGAGGGVVMGYVFERKGNPYLIMNTPINTFFTTLHLSKFPFDIKAFTPIAGTIIQAGFLVVKTDSPFKTIDDLIAEAKKRPKELIQGGSSYTAYTSLEGKIIQKVKRVQWNFISFKNEAEALINVLSGNVHFAVTSPAVVVDHVRAGKVRILLTIAPARYPEFKDAPTTVEAGVGEPIVSYHGILGPPDMPNYSVKKLEAAFKKVVESRLFKKFSDDAMFQIAWRPATEFKKVVERENDQCKTMLSELNLLKKK